MRPHIDVAQTACEREVDNTENSFTQLEYPTNERFQINSSDTHTLKTHTHIFRKDTKSVKKSNRTYGVLCVYECVCVLNMCAEGKYYQRGRRIVAHI